LVRRPVSGRQFEVRAGGYCAVIASVGASLRTLTVDGRPLIVPFEADQLRPAYRGATLAPWPNRVVDGRYRFAGVDHQLAITEPARTHALHGLVAWAEFSPVDIAVDRVTLGTTIEPQSGYPWRVDVQTTYAAGPDGLTQTVTGTNRSATAAPWGTGPHPYLVAGPAPLDEWALELPAGRVLHTTTDRLAPTQLDGVALDGGAFEFRSPRRIGDLGIDHAFTGLVRDSDGLATVRVTDPAGTGVLMSWDVACPWVQIHTADLPGGTSTVGHRAGLAVEPMTCAPDAFNAGSYPFECGLRALEPGESVAASWTIAAHELQTGS
jgi:aldose 1-epimerase